MILVALSTTVAAGGQSSTGAARDPAADLLLKARSAFSRGDTESALEQLRALRAEFPDSPLTADALALSVQYCLAAGDEYRARYFLDRLLTDSPATAAAFSASLAVADHYYDARSWTLALQYYRGAVDAFRPGKTGPEKEFDAALLRTAEISLYHGNDPDTARSYLRRINPAGLAGPQTTLYREMRLRLLWSTITPAALGLTDANVSSLRIDGDDLWVGTWNGGVSRYSVSSARSDAFPGAGFSRSIEVADRRIWVGTAEGLAWYGKGTGRWSSEDSFGGSSSRNVQVVRRVAGSLFAGTLGDGLFRLGDAGWEQVSDGDLPGRFITALAEDARRGRLLIGTMNLGLVVMDLGTGAMSSLAETLPAFTSPNITTILAASDGRVWIGTYGDGLTAWAPDAGVLRRFAMAGGQIGDDWVLASCETDRGLYFGTFGGGVSVLSKATGAWRRIGIADGLASLDVTAIEWRPPYVFFGTLGAGVSAYDEASDGAQP